MAYNISAVLCSRAGRAFGHLAASLPYGIDGSVRPEEMLLLRHQSTVRCNPAPAGPRTRSPCPAGEACLFDLLSDPCETNNVAKKQVTISDQLFKALQYYRRLLVPQSNRPFDPAANPARFNNTWSSWIY